ncbi:hypothetical protein AVEN_72043-1 [Araneus ventricosus]|uniref:Uncharacterized protein n=1 Tax=Araneus ventricosus TaxID=182803 RepID=A0A4Y2KI15_ARAVE|nr:hypothetical protein AVEN_72043-1 [Araneus ventricosus]
MDEIWPKNGTGERGTSWTVKYCLLVLARANCFYSLYMLHINHLAALRTNGNLISSELSLLSRKSKIPGAPAQRGPRVLVGSYRRSIEYGEGGSSFCSTLVRAVGSR